MLVYVLYYSMGVCITIILFMLIFELLFNLAHSWCITWIIVLTLSALRYVFLILEETLLKTLIIGYKNNLET